MSPYHYRLDWETWIHVTASLEELWAQQAPASSYHQQLPDFVQALVVKLLSGDDDVAGLMGVPPRELYKGGEPPSAISIDFASYTFTDVAGQHKEAGAWWNAQPVAFNSLRAYSREGNTLPAEQVRKSPRERHWVLGLCALGVAAALERGASSSVIGVVVHMAVSLMLAFVFGITLTSDYEAPWQFAQKSMPGAQQLPACLQVGILGQQRCCYSYVQFFASGCSFVLLIRFLTLGPRQVGALDLLITVIFPAMAYLSRSALEVIE